MDRKNNNRPNAAANDKHNNIQSKNVGVDRWGKKRTTYIIRTQYIVVRSYIIYTV